MKKVLATLAGVVELGCVVGLAAIGLKRNNDCYKAEMELIDTQTKLWKAEVQLIEKDAEIRNLASKLAAVKSEEQESN